MDEIPHSTEAEISTLGGLLVAPEQVPAVRLIVSPADFYFRDHQRLFSAILALADAGKPIDLLTLCDACPDINGSEISKLMDGIPKLINVPHYASMVRDRARERRVVAAVRKFSFERGDDLASAVGGLSAQLNLEVVADDKKLSTKEMLGGYLDSLEARIQGTAKVNWDPTGFQSLDAIIGGWEPGLTVLAARPSIGKSALALASAAFVAQSTGVLFFSLEMEQRSLCERLLAMESRVDLLRLRRANPDQQLTDAEWSRLTMGFGRVAAMDLQFDCNAAATSDYVCAVVKREQSLRKSKGLSPIRLVVVDYLQLLGDESRSSQDRMSDATRRLHICAQSERVCFLALSQLRRPEQSKFKDGLPPPANVHDLRESGMIEANAAVVLLLERPEHYLLAAGLPVGDYENKAFIAVAKQRNGPVGRLTLGFRKPCALFADPWWTAPPPSAQATLFPDD